MSEREDYAIFKNPYHCKHCGWNRLAPKMTREQALIASKLNRKQSPHHGWRAQRVVMS